MKKVADLHIHTNYSDGVLSPEEIVQKSLEHSFSAIGIVDHDTIDGCLHTKTFIDQYPLELITGCEFSCYEDGKEYHIIGYSINQENDELRNHLDKFRKIRYSRAQKIIKNLNGQGLNINFDLVVEKAAEAPIIRPHIASVLCDLGYVENFKDAFTKYIGDKSPAYEPKAEFPVVKCIQLISKCGGVAVIAHPTYIVNQSTLYKFIKNGLDGIEVVHPMHDEQLEKYYRTIAQQYWLLETGGSDYHGNRDYDEDNFGKYVVPYSVVESIKFRAGKS